VVTVVDVDVDVGVAFVVAVVGVVDAGVELVVVGAVEELEQPPRTAAPASARTATAIPLDAR
jgi:hypothetical protein